MKIAGIDECRRGSLIGPLVICLAITDDEPSLKKLGVKDSKLLTPAQREALFKKLQVFPNFKYTLRILSPRQIDDAIFSGKTNLNWLEADNSCDMIKELLPDIGEAEVIVDCPSPNIKKYKEYLLSKVTANISPQHKADVNYPVVGAASIMAKVTGDALSRELVKKYGDFGSGYPSDPKTKKFCIEKGAEFPEIFRQSWSTYSKLVRIE